MGCITDENSPPFDPSIERVHVAHLPNADIFTRSDVERCVRERAQADRSYKSLPYYVLPKGREIAVGLEHRFKAALGRPFLSHLFVKLGVG
jgi:hypothetical protein